MRRPISLLSELKSYYEHFRVNIYYNKFQSGVKTTQTQCSLYSSKTPQQLPQDALYIIR